MVRFDILRLQLSSYKEVVKDATSKTKMDIANTQKDINREFVPIITNAMTLAYQVCTDKREPGPFRRMKPAMDQHVNNVERTMYSNAT